jgi:uncharacterized protein with LGFP repeats
MTSTVAIKRVAMSAASDIARKFQQLEARGLWLGAPQGVDASVGFGGQVRVYEHGRIYWHPNVGTHEVHGGILAKYLDLGGPGDSPAGGRLLGSASSQRAWSARGT